MSIRRIAAIALIVLGVVAIIVGQFAFGRETHRASVGSLEMSISEQRTVTIPVWAGVAAIVAGGLLLLPLGKIGR